MKKTLTFVVLFACLGLLQSCQPSARVPVDSEDEGSGSEAGKSVVDGAAGIGKPEAGPEVEPSKVVAAPALSAECQALYDELSKLRAGIPYVFHDLERSPREIDDDLKKSIGLADKFLKTCPGNAYTGEIKALLARHLSSRYKRQENSYRDALKRQLGVAKLSRAQRAQIAAQVKVLMKKYLDRIEELGQEALTASRPGERTHCEGLSVLADLSFNYLGDNESHIELSRQYIAAGCEELLEGNQDYHFNIGMSFLRAGQYEEAKQHILKVLKTRSDRPQFVIYNICLFEAMYALGDHEGLENLMIRVQEEYGERLKDGKLPKSIWAQYSQWSLISDFWLGFASYALGDVESARANYRRYIDKVDQLEQELAQTGKQLPSVARIYRDFRAKDYMKYLDEFQGKVPSRDFDSGVDWLVGKPVSFAQSRKDSKVVAILFRQPKNRRALPFLKLLDSLQKLNPEKFTAITLSFMPKGITPEARQQRTDNLRKELQDNELGVTAGFDTSDKYKVFRSLHATVGSASFIMFDSAGQAAWYHVDPTERDLNTLQRVADRLLQ